MQESFEDLKVFQFAIDLMVDIYRATDAFPRQEQYGLVSQMRRASISVVSHIAEGQGRLSFGEWRQLLSEARGSLYEIEAQLIASVRLGYLDPDQQRVLRGRTATVGKLLSGLISYVRKRERAGKTRKPMATGNGQQARLT